MTSELDELKKILDSKTPLRNAPALRSAHANSGSPSVLLGGDKVPYDVNSLMKRFNRAGPSAGVAGFGSTVGTSAFGLGLGGVGSPAEEITSTLKSYDDAIAGAEVRTH